MDPTFTWETDTRPEHSVAAEMAPGTRLEGGSDSAYAHHVGVPGHPGG